MPHIGVLPHIEESDYDSDFQVFIERLELYFFINDIPESNWKSLLLTALSDGIYKTVRDSCHPDLPKHKSYAELVELLRTRFAGGTSMFRKRVRFYQARQEEHEPIDYWYARLHRLAVGCRFGEQTDRILLDRFVSGLENTLILDRLCEENEDLSIERAMLIATRLVNSAAMRQGQEE